MAAIGVSSWPRWRGFRAPDALRLLAFLRRTPSRRPAQRLGLTVVLGGADTPGLAATATGWFIATVLTPAIVRRFGRFAAANVALAAAAIFQLVGAGLLLPLMLACVIAITLTTRQREKLEF